MTLAVAKCAGLTWRTHQSGNFTADDTPLTKTGNSYLRYYLVQAANSVRRYEPEYQQFYTRKYRESTTHHHRRALVLTARKLVRLVDAWLTQQPTLQAPGAKEWNSLVAFNSIPIPVTCFQ
jgi:transposase